MLYADGLLGLIVLGLWLFCVIDVIATDQSNMRNLPKMAWLMIVVLLFDIGALLWLIAGRNWQTRGPSSPLTRAGRKFPGYDRLGRPEATNPDDEAFLRQVRERAESQRREYAERRKREVEEERDGLSRRKDDDPV